jgi:hypothetical protein
MKLLTSIIAILTFFNVMSQSRIKHSLKENGGYFYVYATPAHPKGILFLIPDFNQSEDDLLKFINIPQLAYTHGIVTVIIPFDKKTYADREVVKKLNEATKAALSSYGLTRSQVVIGGYGAGGTIALKYAEYCLQFKADYPMTPAALFAIESQTDLTEAFYIYERVIAKNVNQESMLQAKLFKSMLEIGMGGTPRDQAFNYATMTPFNRLDSKNENIQSLSRTPIRLYHDLDIAATLKEGKSIYDITGAAATELIAQLSLVGNKNAELVKINVDNKTSPDRSTNKMAAINETDLLIWMLKHLNIQ